MKRSLILLALLGALTLLVAAPAQLTLILPQHHDNLPKLAESLIHKGVSVYYYNQSYIIASLDPTEYNGLLLPQPGKADRLFLIQGISENQRNSLSKQGSIVELGDKDILLISRASDLQLRKHTDNSFTELLSNPIQKRRSGFIPPSARQASQDISQLVSQVSADSVAFFLQSLQDLQTRYALADNRFEVASWIKDTFVRFGITNAHLEEFTWNGTQQYNVVATITGSSSPDEYVIVGGHHDSITYTNPYIWAPGADDNASGTVAAIETARVLMAANYQPKCSIRFVTFAAEEFGLHGSHFNAQQAVNTDLNIRLMINHDMIANNPNNTSIVRLMPYTGSLSQSEHASSLVSTYTSLSTVYGSSNSGSSDSYAYWSRGFPVIYFFELDFSQVYHSDNDTMANLDPVYCAEVIRGSLACAVSFANMPGAILELNLVDIGDGSSMLISWQAPNDPAIDHIRIYMSTENPAETEPIEVFNATSYTVSGLIEGQNYNFAVSTVDAFGNESNMVFISGTPLQNPRTPQGFVANPLPQAIELSWAANAELDLAGYKLFRSIFPGAELVPVHDGLLTQNSYTDADVYGSPEHLYIYKVQAIDADGNESVISEAVAARPATFDNGIVVIDATTGGSGANAMIPTDQMVNDYYADVQSGFNYHYVDPASMGRELRLYDLCIYSTVIMHDVDTIIDPISEQVLSVIEAYIALGGNFFYNGYLPSKALEGNAGYPASFADNRLINRVFGVMNADYDTQARMSMALSLESSLQDLHVGEHASLPAFNHHIMRVESLYPASNGDIWYSYHSDYDPESPYSAMQGYPIGVYSEYELGRSLLLTFPLYVIDAQEASQMLYDLLSLKWGETTSNEDSLSPVAGTLQILPNYPNPFRADTTIKLKGSTSLAPTLKIYNLRGQLVRSLRGDKSGTFTWDGMDQHGKSVGSGIYFARISEHGVYANRKLIRIK